ncbi:tape measure protein [Intestinimonas butyriciproducens]|uniref:tape measure protein n=1 Tax=Intestinimonas butyriciproducens TaxID=1297617 RepID=UPI00232D4AC9|nr:tape measure protein [Intestinimonas butyriciproducens]MDB7861065.1 tape measure protein [Intestinimonas butyriciproducens]MDB7863919.1 tape measure protein [Intestinimonas butyriciproducens]
MPDVSIAISAQDSYSSAIKSMAQITKSFSKDMDEMEETLHKLNTNKYSLKLDADAALKELKALEKQFAETGDEADGLKAQMAKANYDNIKRNLDLVTKGAREAETQMKKTGEAFRKADNQSSGGGFKSVVSSLAAAGAGNMIAGLAQNAANTLAASMGGDAGGTLFSSALSSAISGAAIGSVIPGIGTALGAAAGAGIGLLSGGSQIFEKWDDAFKSYVQEAAEEQQTKMSGDIESGSSIAAGREQKKLAFTTLLGSETDATDFLDEVKAMASTTNYTYDEITGYAKSLVKPFGTDQTMDILTALSDTSAALSLNESDNSVLIAGLSRMKLTDKTTQEYLNYFSERGIDVYEALSKWGDAATVAQKVSAGKIKGSEAVEALLAYMQEQYGGLSAQMANTYEGMMGNLEDAKANAQEQYGIGYNAKRKEGIQAEIDYYEDESTDEANQAIGAWYAKLDNEKERYRRKAEADMKESDEYQQAKAEGDAAEMGRLIMQARVQGMNEYNASEGAQEALAAEKALVEGIRGDTALRNDYWDAGYEMGQEYSKGWAAGRAANPVEVEYFDVTGGHQSYRRAMGQQVVPYDNFPALLHQGERVLTASQARAADQGAGPRVQVTVTGNSFYGSDKDLEDRVARRVASEVVRAVELGV